MPLTKLQVEIKQGIEIWQINFKITHKEVNLIRYFETTNDFMEGGAALME